jgi:hypothetical protein
MVYLLTVVPLPFTFPIMNNSILFPFHLSLGMIDDATTIYYLIYFLLTANYPCATRYSWRLLSALYFSCLFV